MTRGRSRRLAAVGLAAVALAGTVSARCGRRAQGGAIPRVIVLGLDGMDFGLATRFMAEGRMPGLARLRSTGGFARLDSAIPPQSPVAWSDFITGMDAGGHGIFDFMHRDPATLLPYLSTSRSKAPKHVLELGGFRIPLSSGKFELLRRGEAFWEVLHRRGIPTTVLRIPAYFPPSGTADRELSGMGTPDLLGGYGTFSYYTTDRLAFLGQRIEGGEVHRVEARDGVVRAALRGPDNPFRSLPQRVEAPFTIYLDPDRPAVKLVVGDEERILQEGEWSDWVAVRFGLIPTQSLAAQARFYLRRVRPNLELYVSPLNLDPFAPAMPISTPASYAGELARATGRYYTQGMPENTGALSAGILSPDEFLAQARIAGDEVIDQFPHVLKQFDRGLLFYYIGNLDLIGHMMWRPMDAGHPAFDPEKDPPLAEVVPETYARLDGLVSYALDHMGSDTLLVVMSDHGFASWRRVFHLNAWLHQNGYLAVKDESLPADVDVLRNVDWSRTRAYGIGLSSLYVNLAGRERHGIVAPEERAALLSEIAARLKATIDPKSGRPVVSNAYVLEETFSDAGERQIGPDIVIGCTKGTRNSDESALGAIGREVLTDNKKPWSGDHIMDTPDVPGILATSRPLKRPAPSLKSLAAAILAEFGIDEFPRGRPARAPAKAN
jgi:predicted AlkP superfamily phosphohydrolase/phosphomutase